MIAQDTIVRDPFYEKCPEALGMTLKELFAVKVRMAKLASQDLFRRNRAMTLNELACIQHPTSWARFECGEISEQGVLG